MNYLFCYRWSATKNSPDSESVWEFVFRHGGHLERFTVISVDFYIPDQYSSLFVLKYPELRRVPALDYIV